jgi:hypothetical protein
MSAPNFKARGFWPFFFTQFFGAFNDNVLKNALAILITAVRHGQFHRRPEEQ